MLQYALAYARKNWHVLPCWWPAEPGVCSCPSGTDCGSIGKHPIPFDGVKSATIDEAQIKAWWDQYPDANIAIATGTISGFWVLDLDGPEGLASMGSLVTRHGRPDCTVASNTGGGGRHIFFKSNRVPRSNLVRVLPGIDTRGDGGYIIAPPSIHANGALYEWHPDGTPGKVKIQHAPPWLQQLVSPKRSGKERDYGDRPKPQLQLEQISPITEGNRNRRVFEIASRAVWEGRKDIDEWVATVNKEKCTPPLSAKELAVIIRSARRYE